MTDTLILDEDGLYDPGDFNDRLLLGLKGTMSEAELHFIRARLRGGMLSKARRGELQTPLPVGLVYDPAGTGRARSRHRRAARAASPVRHVRADRLGARGRAGVRQRRAAVPGPRPHRRAQRRAGVDAAVSLARAAHAAQPAVRRRVRLWPAQQSNTPDGKITLHELPREQWTSLILDAHPGYITFEQFETNQLTLAHNAHAHGTDRAGGPAREGPALLQGLVICGRCGKRMTVRYHHRRGTSSPTINASAKRSRLAAVAACAVPGHGVDHAIGQLLLDTVTPLALEVALTVQAELEARADDADQLRRSHVERARQRAELARRRYLAVDPENRLVADTLEADWNDALRAHQAAQDEYEQRPPPPTPRSTDERKQRIRQLATDFPRLWSDPATPQRERKRIARLLIEDVTLNKTDQIHLHVRFRGGQTTSLTIPTPLNAWQARQTDPDALAMLDRLLDDHTDAETAEQLNAAGHRSGTTKPFTRPIVVHLRRAHNLPSHADRLRARGLLTIAETAEQLGVHPSTIKAWHRAGLLTSHKANDKNERLFDPPDPDDPRLTVRQGWRLRDREPTEPSQRGAL